jgi:hypothetical protein
MALLPSVVKTLDGVFKALGFPCMVSIARYIGPSPEGMGTPEYAAPMMVSVILEKKQRSVVGANGLLQPSTATLTFLDIAALTAATPEVILPSGEVHRAGLLDVMDAIVLPDGADQSLVNLGGFIDVGTGNPVATEAYLG